MKITEKQITELIEKINKYKNELRKEFLNSLSVDIDIPYYLDDDFTTFDELTDAIEDGGGFNCDVIYYANAIEYLTENDPSLMESLTIAAELGFSLENLNSETLASLLKSENVRQEYYEEESAIEQYFDDLEIANTHIEILEDIDLEAPETVEEFESIECEY